MQLTNLEEFDGEPDGKLQGPTSYYGHRVMEELKITADRDLISRIGKYLTPDSPAEEWYASTGNMINSWNAFETQFKTRFPGIQKARKRCGVAEEMVELELRVEDLDKTELYGGVEVERTRSMPRSLLDLAKRAKIDTGVANIVLYAIDYQKSSKIRSTNRTRTGPPSAQLSKMVDKAYIRDGSGNTRNERRNTSP